MGAWGTAIFSDDLAADIRGDYNLLLQVGKSDEEATEEILKMYYEDCKGDEDEPVMWFALALSQWNKGRLDERIKEKALEFIRSGADLERWEGKEKKKREEVLKELEKKLLSPMPERKKIKKLQLRHCKWRPGDLLAYRFSGDTYEKEDSEYWGKYLLFRILQIRRFPVLKCTPEIYNERAITAVYLWVGDTIPEPGIVKNLQYAILGERKGQSGERILENSVLLGWDDKDLKKREIVVIGHDDGYEEVGEDLAFPDITAIVRSWCGFQALECRLPVALKKIKENREGLAKLGIQL